MALPYPEPRRLTLARSWRDWCQVDCVLDPERLFSDVGYLMDIAIGEEDGTGKGRWRLLLLEDCDELIRGEAKHTAGQALSRDRKSTRLNSSHRSLSRMPSSA